MEDASVIELKATRSGGTQGWTMEGEKGPGTGREGEEEKGEEVVY